MRHNHVLITIYISEYTAKYFKIQNGKNTYKKIAYK